MLDRDPPFGGRRWEIDLDDLNSTGAAAEVAHHPALDLSAVGRWGFATSMHGRHDLCRVSDAAL